jgi:hypothetical protein
MGELYMNREPCNYPDEDPLVKPGLACWHCGAEIVSNPIGCYGALLHVPCVEPYARAIQARFNACQKNLTPELPVHLL